MKTKPLPSKIVPSLLAACGGPLCAIAILAFAFYGERAQAGWRSEGAQIYSITNFFENDGNDPHSSIDTDAYPGFAPFAGWNTAWNNSNGATNMFVDVINTSPLNASNNYLNVTISNTTSAVATRRQIASYLSPATGVGLTTNGQTVNVTSQPMRYRFDWRLDSFVNYTFTNELSCVTNYITCTNDLSLCTTSSVYADPPLNYTVTTNIVCTNTGNRFVSASTNWGNSRNDNLFMHASTGQRNSFNADGSYAIFAQMGASRIQDPFGPANQWLLYDGSPIRNDQGAGSYVQTGYFFTNGVVYHFDIICDPRDKTYTVAISDNTGTNATYHSPTLRWRSFGDVTVVQNRTYLHWGGTLNDTNSVSQFSVDSISCEFLPPSEFPPFVANLVPNVRAPFARIAAPAAGAAGTGVPPLGYTPDFDNPLFWPAGRGITFVAQTGGGASNDFSGGGDPWRKMGTARTKILESGVGLKLNGVDVSGSLAITRPFGGYGSNYVKVAYAGLQPNTSYDMLISVTNSAGAVKQRKLNFDTFDESFVKVIEAEDYNYGDAGYTRPAGVGSAPTVGGMFQDNPTPSDFTNSVYLNQSTGYIDRMGYLTNAGANYIDYFVPNSTLQGIGNVPTNGSAIGNVYRFYDAVGTAAGLDLARKKYEQAGARDFVVTNIFAGEWLNYSRTFAAGTYNFYLRAANNRTGGSGAAVGINAVNLDYVTSDPTQPGQTTTNIGVFLVPYTGGVINFTNSPLINTNGGGVLTVTLPAGVHTLRLTSTNANNDLLLNYIVAAPVSSNAPSVAITSPADGASFSAGANITLQATATVGSTVTYYNGSTSLGSSGSSPYTVNWASVPTGRYTITAKATSGSGFTASSAPITVKVGSPPAKVLFVIGGKAGDIGAVDVNNVGNGDQYFRNLFAAKGWSRTDFYATNLPAVGGRAASAGFDLVVVSASIQSGDGAPLRDVNVPVWCAEQGVAGTMCFCHENTIATEFGAQSGFISYQVRPDVVGQPGEAGLLAGAYNFAPATSAANFMGSLNENVIPILSNTNATGYGASGYTWYYPAGAELWNGIIAGGCRYMWYNATIENIATNNLTANGTNLLNAGFDLVLANPSFSGVTIYEQPPVISGNNVTIAFRAASYETAADYSLWSATAPDQAYTKDLTALITKLDDRDSRYTASTTINGPNRVYRVRRN